jgi:hypothetical protein
MHIYKIIKKSAISYGRFFYGFITTVSLFQSVDKCYTITDSTLLMIVLEACKVNSNYGFISNYPDIITRENYNGVTVTKSFFCSIIHHYLQSF